MLKFYREIDFREMGHKLKKMLLMSLFSTIFRYQPIRCTDLIEFKNYFSHLLIDFANCLPSCYAYHYLNWRNLKSSACRCRVHGKSLETKL